MPCYQIALSFVSNTPVAFAPIASPAEYRCVLRRIRHSSHRRRRGHLASNRSRSSDRNALPGRVGKMWIQVFPHTPVTARPLTPAWVKVKAALTIGPPRCVLALCCLNWLVCLKTWRASLPSSKWQICCALPHGEARRPDKGTTS